MTKKGLVLEGGALRGLFSAGVMDVLMEHNIDFDGVIGVSAGAAFGCNYKSRQPGRVIRYNKRLAHDWRYCSVRSLFTTGDLFGGEFCYHYMPEHIDVFNQGAFNANPMEFVVVCVDVETGEPVYKHLMHYDYATCEYIRASASMPLVAKIVELDGRKLLDGGIADSIPLAYFQQIGYEKNLVIVTQAQDYRKSHSRLTPLLKLGLRKYPNLIHAFDTRYIMYNKQLEFLAEQERAGKAFVVRPPEKLPINHICHDPDVMQQVYDTGRETALGQLDDIKAFLEL